MNWNSASPADLMHFDPQEVFLAGLRLPYIAETAYPINRHTTIASYRVPDSRVHSFAPQAWEEIDELSLYLHIPFHENRCGYCEYSVLDSHLNFANEEEYFNLLAKEFRLWRDVIHTQTKSLRGFDIGGSASTAVNFSHIARVVSFAQHYFNLPPEIEISIETSPHTTALEPEKMRAIYQLGIRRISMRVPSIHQSLLNRVGREATNLIFNKAAAANIREAGFQKFNLDLMCKSNNQPLGDLEATLKHAVSLNSETITLYPIHDKYISYPRVASPVSLNQMNAETNFIHEYLLGAGYMANSGMNTYSRLPGDPGISCYQTERVVHGTPYLGMGLGAQSLSQLTLAYNAGVADQRMRLYREKIRAGGIPIQDLYHLSMPAAISNMVSSALYFGEIKLTGFERKFGQTFQDWYPAEWDFVLRNGLMHTNGEMLKLTHKGCLHFSGVTELFHAGTIKSHLLALATADQHIPALPARPRHLSRSRAIQACMNVDIRSP